MNLFQKFFDIKKENTIKNCGFLGGEEGITLLRIAPA